MGYDEQDCRNVAAVGELNVTYPRNIHGRIFETEIEYNDAVADFINKFLIVFWNDVTFALELINSSILKLNLDVVKHNRELISVNELMQVSSKKRMELVQVLQRS